MRTPRLLVLDAPGDLRRQVERATSTLRPRPEVVGCEGFDTVHDVIESKGPFDVLIAGPMVSSDEGLHQLRRLRVQLPQTSLILAFESWRSGSLRETIRTGALDILRLPVPDEAILESVEQALEVGWAAAPEPVAPRAARDEKGTVIAVVSATGGCGKTFLSTNLAYHLQSKFDRRTCLIDLDLQFGELSTALRLKPPYTIADLVANDDAQGEELAARLEEALATHDTGIKVLAAPEEPADADRVGVADVSRVIEAARSRFDHVIIDTPASLSETVLAALEHADQIFAIATLDLPSVRNLGVMLTTLKRLKVPQDRVRLVLNKVEPDVGMDIDRVTKYFPQGFSIVVPYGREVNRSLNMGMPMLAYAPRSDVSKALASGLATTLPVEGALGGDGALEAGSRGPGRDPGGRRFGRWRKKPA